MSHNQKLVYMANQIATFFDSQTREDQVGRVETHIRDFWDPRMRAELLTMIDAGEAKLTPLAAAAAERLREGPPPGERPSKPTEELDTSR